MRDPEDNRNDQEDVTEERKDAPRRCQHHQRHEMARRRFRFPRRQLQPALEELRRATPRANAGLPANPRVRQDCGTAWGGPPSSAPNDGKSSPDKADSKGGKDRLGRILADVLLGVLLKTADAIARIIPEPLRLCRDIHRPQAPATDLNSSAALRMCAVPLSILPSASGGIAEPSFCSFRCHIFSWLDRLWLASLFGAEIFLLGYGTGRRLALTIFVADFSRRPVIISPGK